MSRSFTYEGNIPLISNQLPTIILPAAAEAYVPSTSNYVSAGSWRPVGSYIDTATLGSVQVMVANSPGFYDGNPPSLNARLIFINDAAPLNVQVVDWVFDPSIMAIIKEFAITAFQSQNLWLGPNGIYGTTQWETTITGLAGPEENPRCYWFGMPYLKFNWSEPGYQQVVPNGTYEYMGVWINNGSQLSTAEPAWRTNVANVPTGFEATPGSFPDGYSAMLYTDNTGTQHPAFLHPTFGNFPMTLRGVRFGLLCAGNPLTVGDILGGGVLTSVLAIYNAIGSVWTSFFGLGGPPSIWQQYLQVLGDIEPFEFVYVKYNEMDLSVNQDVNVMFVTYPNLSSNGEAVRQVYADVVTNVPFVSAKYCLANYGGGTGNNQYCLLDTTNWFNPTGQQLTFEYQNVEYQLSGGGFLGADASSEYCYSYTSPTAVSGGTLCPPFTVNNQTVLTQLDLVNDRLWSMPFTMDTRYATGALTMLIATQNEQMWVVKVDVTKSPAEVYINALDIPQRFVYDYDQVMPFYASNIVKVFPKGESS